VVAGAQRPGATPRAHPSAGQHASAFWGLAVLVTLSMVLGVGILLMGHPVIAFAAMLAGPFAFALLRWPDIAPAIVMFLLYTNTPAILAKVHGVPKIAAATIPLLLCLPILRDILQGKKIIVAPVLPLVVAFIVIQWISGLFALKPDVAVANTVEGIIEALVLFALITNAIRTRGVLRSVVWGLILAGAFLGGLAFYQQVTGTYDNIYWGYAQPSAAYFDVGEDPVLGEVQQLRLGGPLGQQNRFAQLMSMLLPLALFQSRSARSGHSRRFAFLAFILIGIGIALAFSRGAAVGLGATFLLMLGMGYVKMRQLALLGVALLAVSLAVPQYAGRLASLEVITDALTSSGGPGMRNADGSVRSRLTEMIAATLMFIDHPVLGVGPRMYREHYGEYARVLGIKVKGVPRQSHNLYLGLAAETGLLGLLAFALIMFMTLRELLRARAMALQGEPDTELATIATSVFVALVAYLSIGMFLHLAYISFFWGMTALAAATCYVIRSEKGEEGRYLTAARTA
jgi:O-antigen ligase